MYTYIYMSEGTDSLFMLVQLAVLLQTYSSFKMHRIKFTPASSSAKRT